MNFRRKCIPRSTGTGTDSVPVIVNLTWPVYFTFPYRVFKFNPFTLRFRTVFSKSIRLLYVSVHPFWNITRTPYTFRTCYIIKILTELETNSKYIKKLKLYPKCLFIFFWACFKRHFSFNKWHSYFKFKEISTYLQARNSISSAKYSRTNS